MHIAHETVPTPWERKGAVMREMVERAKGRDIVLVDGVKILHPDGWALVLPDPEEPIVHVWAEAGSDHEAAPAGGRVRPPHQPDRLASLAIRVPAR